MYQLKTFRTGAWIVSSLILLAACRKKDTDLQELDNLVNFETTSQGIVPADQHIQIKLKLSRAVTQEVPLIINVTTQGLEYGVQFTTSPAIESGTITTSIPSGSNEAVVTVSKVPGAPFVGDEKLTMNIYSSGSPIIIGGTKEFTLSFAELIATTGTATMDGGGQFYTNKVFVDLSANRSTSVNRNTWDLGFYSGADYRVTLNSSLAMMAKQIDKNDLTQVTAVDTVGFGAEVAFSQTNPRSTQMPYIDHPSGDLTRTAIAEVAANAADNKVYIINRGLTPGATPATRGWKKIRVIRNSTGGYTLQHADIASATFQEINIAKDADYFFRYASFETGALTVEPPALKWDIAWTYFANSVNFGGGDVPYLYQDIIIQNRNVQVAKVTVAPGGVTFSSFNETNLAGLTFSTSQTTIGADWRAGGGPSSAPVAHTDRFYVVKDGEGNIYKLRFTGLTNAGGERGYPSYEMALVKEG